jgi:PAS domain-containing protein
VQNSSDTEHIDSLAEAAARKSFHEKLLDNLYDGVYFVGAERRITYWNKGAEQLTGFPAAEASGRHCFDNFLMHVDGVGCALCLEGCPLGQTLADGEYREAEFFCDISKGIAFLSASAFHRSKPTTAQSWARRRFSATSAR